MITKQDRIKEYNQSNPGYCITGIKTTSRDALAASKKYNAHTLYELYARPSDAKIASYNEIIATYNPLEIIALQGSCHSYGVVLQASNGDLLHITKQNNYLLDLV